MHVDAMRGFKGTVNLSCATSAPRIGCQVSNGSVKLGRDLAVPFEVIVTSGAGAAVGSYNVIVTGQGTAANLKAETITHNEKLQLNVVTNSIH